MWTKRRIWSRTVTSWTLSSSMDGRKTCGSPKTRCMARNMNDPGQQGGGREMIPLGLFHISESACFLPQAAQADPAPAADFPKGPNASHYDASVQLTEFSGAQAQCRRLHEIVSISTLLPFTGHADDKYIYLTDHRAALADAAYTRQKHRDSDGPERDPTQAANASASMRKEQANGTPLASLSYSSGLFCSTVPADFDDKAAAENYLQVPLQPTRTCGGYSQRHALRSGRLISTSCPLCARVAPCSLRAPVVSGRPGIILEDWPWLPHSFKHLRHYGLLALNWNGSTMTPPSSTRRPCWCLICGAPASPRNRAIVHTSTLLPFAGREDDLQLVRKLDSNTSMAQSATLLVRFAAWVVD
ncbi:hypothetical protein B0H12DRAFT_1330107 [Mycena haematopus]|nr:hypothetical protein B0H12DRAFT_1330107 [Mycena haematopus]